MTDALAALFAPRSVAVVGASRRRGRIGSEIFHNIRAAGFTGQVWPVNPAGEEVEGVHAFASVGDIPGPVDLAVVVVPCEQVMAVVDDCVAKGVRALLVISAGFGEVGPEGRARQATLLDAVRLHGLRMVGPNCMGLINTDPAVSLDATFSPVRPLAGRVALSTQSGALGLAILDYAKRLHIGFSTFVSIGNKADVSTNDLIEFWADDPRTDVILLYVESFGNPRRFSELARSVGRRKPIVAVKAGRSSSGARAASSHTGALASSDAIVDALFRQSGVIRTQTLEELFDVATLLAHQPLPRGHRVAILTNAGGPGILAADACEANGLVVPALSETTRTALRAFLPSAASVSNPVDMLAAAPAAHFGRAMRLLLADEGIDALLTIFIPPLVIETADVAAAMAEAGAGARKPILATFMSAQGTPPELGSIPCYAFPEAAASALARVVTHADWREQPAGTVQAFDDVRREAAGAIVAAAQARGGGWLAPQEVHGILDAYGIGTAPLLVALDETSAVDHFRSLGGPVVLKADGPNLLHKTDVGGVALDLRDESAVRAAYRAMVTRLGDRLTAVLVQPMVDRGVEILIGAMEDPLFGPVVACGTGGTLAELFADVVFRLHPITDAAAAAMVDGLKGAPLLRGYRGAPVADESALRDTLQRVSALVGDWPVIREFEINPLVVGIRGACAVDARIRVTPLSRP